MLAENFLLVGVRFIEPALSGVINVAPTIEPLQIFDFWLKILMLATPNSFALDWYIEVKQSSASRQGDISVRSNIDFSNEVTDYSLSSSHSQFAGGGF